MIRRARFAKVVVVVALGIAGLGGPGGDDRHTVRGFGAEQEAAIQWALALFEEGGLPVPGIDFTHHDPDGPCHGHPGWHERRGERSSIAICSEATGAVADFLLLHEVAHAWDAANLGDDRRAAFLASHGLDQWWGADPDRWHEYGAEQAAEVIVWGLIDRPARMARLPRPYNGCAELLDGYVLLTGRAPLHGYTDLC